MYPDADQHLFYVLGAKSAQDALEIVCDGIALRAISMMLVVV
jgi:aromatic ring-opening dioxygenase catalytic subunit (LigB family)